MVRLARLHNQSVCVPVMIHLPKGRPLQVFRLFIYKHLSVEFQYLFI